MCSFPTPIFSKSLILAQILSKRTFLMPIFPEPIFPQYSPIMAQNPFFVLNRLFLTPSYPKEPNLVPNPLFFLKCPFPSPILSKSPFLAQTLPKRSLLMPTFPESIVPQYSPIMAQKSLFSTQQSFSDTHFFQRAHLTPNLLFLLECPFPTPIFSERFILAQTLPKRTFLMPTFSEPIFSQYSPIMAQNPSFQLSIPFLTPNLPKEPSLAKIPYFFSNVPFLHLFSLKAPIWPILDPREPFSCRLSLKSHFGPKFPYSYPNVPFPVQQLFLE